MVQVDLSSNQTRNALLAILAFVGVVWFLRAAVLVLVPLAVALFLVMLLQPVQRYLSTRLPSPFNRFAVVLTMLLLVGTTAAALGLVALAASQTVSAAPQHTDHLIQLWEQASEWARQRQLPVPEELVRRLGAGQRIGEFARGAVVGVWNLLSSLVLVFFLVLLMLLEAPTWAATVRKATPAGEEAERTLAVVAIKIRQ